MRAPLTSSLTFSSGDSDTEDWFAGWAAGGRGADIRPSFSEGKSLFQRDNPVVQRISSKSRKCLSEFVASILNRAWLFRLLEGDH